MNHPRKGTYACMADRNRRAPCDRGTCGVGRGTRMDDLSARRALLKASGLKRGRALDVGMGDCACMSFLLAAEGFDVVGIDRSSHAVHAAREQARGRKFKGSFLARRMDAEHLVFTAGEFDVVLAYRAIHHADNVEKVLHEMWRVCRARGSILVAELNDRGQREYRHEPDHGRLAAHIHNLLRRMGGSVRRMETPRNTMFVCRR